MKVPWASGPAPEQAVQKTLNLLVKKSRATRESNDRAFVYIATVSKAFAVSDALPDLLDMMFGGSAEGLVLPDRDAKDRAMAANKAGAK